MESRLHWHTYRKLATLILDILSATVIEKAESYIENMEISAYRQYAWYSLQGAVFAKAMANN
jgi:hypothetical protein